MPDFLGCLFSELNHFDKPIEPGQAVVSYHDAQPFTRFYGSIACDQPLEVMLTFSNDEVDREGRRISDENISSLNYDAEAVKQFYDPKKQAQTGKYFSTIFGHWIRVEIKNTGEKATETLRVFVRGSVF